ncbi:alkaline phosphatase family protein [Chloroflexota bacterium]
MILVLGIDAATWNIIKPNLDELPTFRRLIEIGKSKELILTEKLISAPVWCGMFSGKLPEEHHHESYVKNGDIVKRENIGVDFIWDILAKEKRVAKALNIPFVVPPYSFGVNFKPVGFGLPTSEKEWEEELDRVTTTTKELMSQEPDLLIAVYTLLDRIQHFHWGEDCVLEWYQKVDARLNEILFETGFTNKNNKLIVISDHGFCSFGEAKVQTLPEQTEEGKLKGDHQENAFLVTINIDYEINQPQDVFHAIRQEVS